MNKICVYAIAKNEEAFAERWFNSMKEADKVIVLDTGSSDRTVEVLKSLGAEVYEKTYETFRFDEARNDSLDCVSDEYNVRVCTDLDEVFEPGWAEILREEWNAEIHKCAEYMYTHDHLETGENGFSYILNKIHDKDFRWQYAVHEHLYPLAPVDEENILNLTDKIHLHHFPDFEKSRVQYLDLLKIRLDEDPTDYHGHIQFGLELETNKMYEEAIDRWNFVLNNFTIPENIDRAGIWCHLGECYSALGIIDRAIAAYSQGLFEDEEYRENYYCLAKLYAEQEKNDMAIGILKEAEAKTIRKYHWLEGVVTWSWAIYSILCSCYIKKNDFENALINASKALSFEPNHPELQEQYVWCLQQTLNK